MSTYNMGDVDAGNLNTGNQTVHGNMNIYFGQGRVEPAPEKDPRKVFLSYARATS